MVKTRDGTQETLITGTPGPLGETTTSCVVSQKGRVRECRNAGAAEVGGPAAADGGDREELQGGVAEAPCTTGTVITASIMTTVLDREAGAGLMRTGESRMTMPTAREITRTVPPGVLLNLAIATVAVRASLGTRNLLKFSSSLLKKRYNMHEKINSNILLG